MAKRKRKSKNYYERINRLNENVAYKKIKIDSNSFRAGTRKIERMFVLANKMKLSNKEKAKLKKAEKEAIKRGDKEFISTKSLSKGGKESYYADFQRVRKEIYYKFGISDIEKIKHQHIKAIIRDRIEAGQSANTIHGIVYAVNFVQSVGIGTGILSKGAKIVDHDDMLAYLKYEKIERSSKNSHRYKANEEECKLVINELYNYKGGKYLEFANIARLQFLAGGRRSEVIKLKVDEVHVNAGIVEFNDAKGGLDNKVWVNHWDPDDKNFVHKLVRDAVDGKLFRIKDSSGSYMSEEKVVEKLNRLLVRMAKRINVGTKEKNFTSHSLRGGFGHSRVTHYAKIAATPGGLDAAIEQKILQQKRLKKRYEIL
ncbi:site-specific integrase [Fictibacillus sp. 23RED33]|uniref:site-specific integrase n=1 Tax=Fictibacillus sp. 23RED33 TaxID=2745879 RepID=UPI0018CDE6F6|nr:site-specific integrase [Fictibacillus sp. 23RED33]MBH0175871.1 site-specific integrase [Fictibacillus sp. 23RED33]